MVDLFAEVYPQWKRFGGFFGAPWVWCMLHNFGGNTGEGSCLAGMCMHACTAAVEHDDVEISRLLSRHVYDRGGVFHAGGEVIVQPVLKARPKKKNNSTKRTQC